MAKKTQDRATSERNAFALVFLITFGVLSVAALWLIYQQFAQVFTRTGQCTVLAISTRQDSVDLDNPTNGAKQYAITFTVSLLTPEGQRLQVPGYYTSANFDASDQNTINKIKSTYHVGSTSACGYTYLDPSGIKAIFEPAVPLEGFLFPGFFLVVSLVIVGICVATMRKGPVQEPPLPDEMSEEIEIGDAQQV